MPLGSWRRVLQPVSATVPGPLPLRNIAHWRCQSCRLCHCRRRRHSAVCNSLILTLTNLSPFIMNAHKGGTLKQAKRILGVCTLQAACSTARTPGQTASSLCQLPVASSQFPLRVDCLSVCLSVCLPGCQTVWQHSVSAGRLTEGRTFAIIAIEIFIIYFKHEPMRGTNLKCHHNLDRPMKRSV